MSSGEDVIEMACLGRTFRLGMLYDCRRDQLVPGMTLWNDKTLKSALDSSPQVGSDYEIIAEDNLHTKASLLNISGSLKLSFLGGFVEVSGSAKYLTDRKCSKHQARITLKYWSISRFDQLTMEQLGNIEYPNVISNKMATHVVVGVVYGADAIFVFDRMVKISENESKVCGEMKALVKRLPLLLNVEGGAKLEMKAEDKKEASNVECKFHGDIRLPKNPTTFEEAVEVFNQLPQLMKGKDGSVGVPKKVWLYPLSNLDCSAVKIMYDIHANLICQAEKVMEDLFDYEIQSNDLMQEKACSYFTTLCMQVSNFKDMILQYRMGFFEKLSSLLPSIREGGKKETELTKMFRSKEESPFNSHHLKTWLQAKRNEIMILGKHFQHLKDISCVEFAKLPSDLAAILQDLKYYCVICCSFKCLKSNDVSVNQMQAFLETQAYSKEVKEVESWSQQRATLLDMREKIKKFITFAETNKNHEGVRFVVVNLIDQCDNGAISITLFKNGISEVFDPPNSPDDIKPSSITHCSISLQWSKPKYGCESVKNYIVEYGCGVEWNSIQCWKTIKTSGNETSITIDGLQTATPYCFKVCSECEVGVSEYSDVTIPISTCQSGRELAIALKAESTLISQECGPPTYKVKGEEVELPGKMLHKMSIGKPARGVVEKVLIVLGAAGAGKSTLINGMINYIFGVQWKDDFRFQLITEEEKSQAYSQTQAITAYTIHHMDGSPVEYTLTVIDTPGFGDTSGLERDKQTTEQIREFFSVRGHNGISHLNGIGFVTQSSLPRLTTTQKYIFDSILSIFGKDVQKNIFIMVTFADGQKPPVMKAIEAAKIPHSGFYKFNNSALYAEISHDDDDDNFDEMFWKMGGSSFRKFFLAFQKAEAVSLTMTKDVLQHRERLETIIAGLQVQMKVCLVNIETLHHYGKILNKHENDIATNKNFTFEVPMPKYKLKKCPKGTYVTNCMRCSITCHYPCAIPNDDQKMGCAAMDHFGSNAKCTVCEEECHWSMHRNTGERFDVEYIFEKQTSMDLKKKFEKASEGKAAVEEMLASHQRQLEEAHAKLHGMIEEAQQCLEKLDEIALKHNPITQVQYIELLIKAEKQEAKRGWMERVDYLEKTKEQAEYLAAMKGIHDINKKNLKR